MEERNADAGYVDVNGLQMYYEMHGTGQSLVLLHGAFSAIGTSFGQLLPGLAENRQVIGSSCKATDTPRTSIAR